MKSSRVASSVCGTGTYTGPHADKWILSWIATARKPSSMDYPHPPPRHLVPLLQTLG